MSLDQVRLCIERVIPERVPSEEMAVAVPKRWETGMELDVRFLGGGTRVRNKVRQYAEQWHDFANIRFRFGERDDAVIRIAFVADGTSWSAVGTDALNRDWFPREGPTMNYGWLNEDSPEEEFSRVVVHEFGHALGCIHEHQSPASKIPWNEAAVYRYYAARGWTPAVVDHNVFRKYDRDQMRYTDFDEKSIMLYPVPRELTLDGYEVGWNRQLSETDKRFIGEVYPKAD